MMRRIHLATTALLALAALGFAWQTVSLRERAARTEQELHHRLDALHDLAKGPEPETITIRVGDSVEVESGIAPELNRVETVAADGKVLVPPVGWVHVAGLTREEAETFLRAKLETYYVEVDAFVRVAR